MKASRLDLTIKVATAAWEFEQIHRLNYRTFVEEIPQHAPNPEGRLVDRFHAENIYLVALRDRTLVGMLALRRQRPFSLESKLPDFESHLPAGRKPVEVRLLAIEPAYRKTALFVSLFEHAVRRCREDGFNLAVISGTTRQIKLYRHLGFTPFGPLVGTSGALYQPMYLTGEAFDRVAERSATLRDLFSGEPKGKPALNLLPGPVRTTPEVDVAFATPPISHRSPEFLAQLRDLRRDLCALTRANDVQVMPGSGSLGNSVIAAQLSLHATRGLVLSNGEFGERLAAEARRVGLDFDWLRGAWGCEFDLAEVEARVARLPRGGWLWCVHHETSTGMLNPLDALKTMAHARGVRLCLDAISSLGAVRVDLRGVHLATATSGKGLGGYPGLALVFHDYLPASAERLPSYLDLGHWAAHASAPHTHSSNLVAALAAAVRQATPARMARISENAAWLRSAVEARGFTTVTSAAAACPAVLTLTLDLATNATQLGEALERAGFWLNFRSAHLESRNWIQISLLGDPPREELERFVSTLPAIVRTGLQADARPAAARATAELAVSA